MILGFEIIIKAASGPRRRAGLGHIAFNAEDSSRSAAVRDSVPYRVAIESHCMAAPDN